MAANGSGKNLILGSSQIGDIRQPFVGSNFRVYYVSYVSGKQEIFSMNKDGLNNIQLSINSGDIKSPRFFQGKVYGENGALNFISNTGSLVRLNIPCDTYDVSSLGEIVYSKWDYSVSPDDKQKGTLWIMNADGSNRRQLTFNNF